MRTEIDVLLSKIDDERLRADLRGQIARLEAKRTFGLVFESHYPERVWLPAHPLRPGVTPDLRDDPSSPGFEMLSIDGKNPNARKMQHPDGPPPHELTRSGRA